MRTITCDPYEFDCPDSEEFIELAIGMPHGHCTDLQAFLAECKRPYESGKPAPPDWWHWDQLIEYVKQFANFDVPSQLQVPQTYLLNNDWNDVEVAVVLESCFLLYHWYTTA